jgi:hypothetical protein
MEALRWADDAETHGYTRIVFDSACERSGHEAGDFILIYARNAMWASWGIASREGELTLWRASNGATVGTFPTMQQTLQAVMQAASLREVSARRPGPVLACSYRP